MTAELRADCSRLPRPNTVSTQQLVTDQAGLKQQHGLLDAAQQDSAARLQAVADTACANTAAVSKLEAAVEDMLTDLSTRDRALRASLEAMRKVRVLKHGLPECKEKANVQSRGRHSLPAACVSHHLYLVSGIPRGL